MSLFTDAPAPTMIRLRPYQVDALQSIERAESEGFTSLLAVLATGLGKTTIFSEQIRRDHEANPRAKTLVLAHRAELIGQGAKRIEHQNPGLIVGIESGNQRAACNCDVVVASVQTIGRENSDRLSWFKPTRIITDEAHHACANGYVSVYRRYGVFEGLCKHLGVTATAHRLDNKPLHGRERAIFDHVAFNYGLKDAIIDGWLADLRGFRVGMDFGLDKISKVRGDYAQGELADAVNTSEHNEFAFEQWQLVASDRKTIAFCVDVQHAKDLAECFRSRGVRAAHVDGKMDRLERDDLIKRFKSGQLQFLANVEIATEGFDVPDIRCVLMLRPTQSWALFVQMIGRGTRTLPGVIDGISTPQGRKTAVRESRKPDCIVLDVVDLTSQHSAVTLPAAVGMPTSLDLEGKGLLEAFSLVEQLGDGGRGWLFGGNRKLSDIPRKLTEVDLLAELETPADIQEISRMSWLQTGEDLYHLGCGADASEKKREARMYCDTLGRWHVELSSERRRQIHDIGEDRKAAFEAADRLVRDIFPGATAVATLNSAWRNDAPTQKQKDFLKKWAQMDDFQLSKMTKGQAAAAMDKILADWRRKGGR